MIENMRLGQFLSLATALFAATLFIAPGAARAASQALGLVATGEATPLQCGGGICVGFFSTFCLEKDRLPPASWTAYRPMPGADITLIVDTSDGRTVRLPAKDYATFKTRLDFTSILASVEQSRLAHFNPVRLRIAVGPLVSLLPEPSARDANPHTPEMLATVTGPYRRTGKHFFDDGRGRSGAVAMVTRMINLMPRRGHLAKARRRAAFLDTRARIAGRRDADATRFGAIVAGCEAVLGQSSGRFNMRECLEIRHTIMQTKTNKEFWKAIGGV